MSIAKRWMVLIGLVFLAWLLAGCVSINMPPQETAPTQTVPPLAGDDLVNTQPEAECVLAEPAQPFVGLWVAKGSTPEEDRILSITDKNVYSIETDPKMNSIVEQLSEIQSIDTEKQVITLKINWLRANGKMGGTDMRTWYLAYQVDGDQMHIGISRDFDVPVPEISQDMVFVRQ